MEIKHHTTGDDGIFYIDEQGERLGDMRYMLVNNTEMDIYHTEVDAAYEGKSLGKQLIEAGINYARQKHFKIIPSCTFAKSVLTGNDQFKDVLA
ncbi:GNAT family N-acetyltransferase [Mucilaginibacter aquatilis]|uniref:GNAT family N-acetyltransferase n=1 Tax=Mucilaginibacter aquatilis TaxID=1517760 RepID=A0A6I4IQJ0_9SPHI|nr:GNAT family N-acetyltransferase [Mucilaginibacter aquatilis]MVN91214.1 GNAT family N-acetyltransferase [Mucilaginibacter aquatilis]